MLIEPTRSAMDEKRGFFYAVPLRWMRHWDDRTSQNWNVNQRMASLRVSTTFESYMKVIVILVCKCGGIILSYTVPPQQTVSAQFTADCWSTISDQLWGGKMATLSAERFYHFASECSATDNASCNPFVRSIVLRSALSFHHTPHI